MGELVVMVRPAGSARRHTPDSGSAEILFFTGVRYARMPDVADALASVTPGRRPTRPRRGPRKGDSVKSA
ncbi:MAG: hypothetical protein P4L76_02090 [Beijerinckiaceae bacterium]|nr:hypothetical protein [Beijerinckiaceae bacterium]